MLMLTGELLQKEPGAQSTMPLLLNAFFPTHSRKATETRISSKVILKHSLVKKKNQYHSVNHISSPLQSYVLCNKVGHLLLNETRQVVLGGDKKQ